jgi:integrase
MEKPQVGVNDRDALPTEDARAMLLTLGDISNGSRWAAAILQGMRQAECLGLTWDAVDLDRGSIDISWQLQSIAFEHGCPKANPCGRKKGGYCPDRVRRQVPANYEVRELAGRWCLVRPKSKAGTRPIPMVDWMVAILRRWKDVAPVNPYNLVWAEEDGLPKNPDADRAEWDELQRRANVTKSINEDGVPEYYTIHEARHTTATLLLQAKVDPKTVMAIMGHSNILTTQKYQHVDDGLARSAMDAVMANLQLDA